MRFARRRRYVAAVPHKVNGRVALAGEHQLVVSRTPGQDTLELADRTGSLRLRIVIDAAGVTVAATGTKLAFQTDGPLALEAAHLTLRGRLGIALETDAALVSHARSQQLRASHGSIVIEANDDVKLEGERILLNT